MALMVLVPGSWGFGAAAVLLGIGSQLFPPAHAAVVSSLASGRDRDAALAASRALRNAGMGIGALAATLAIAGGDVMRGLAVITAVAYVISAMTVLTMPLVPAAPAPPARPLSLPPGHPARPNNAMRALYLGNLPYPLCFDVLEIALPAVLVTQLHVSPAWASSRVCWQHRPRDHDPAGECSLAGAIPPPDGARSLRPGAGLVLPRFPRLNHCPRRLGGTPDIHGRHRLHSRRNHVHQLRHCTRRCRRTPRSARPPPRSMAALDRSGKGRVQPVLLTGLLAVSPALLWFPLAASTARRLVHLATQPPRRAHRRP
jgi:hypothetical protein